MDYILGMDIGTGSTKAVALDRSGKAFYTHSIPYPSSSPQPGYHEQNPVQIWNAFRDCISFVSRHLKTPPAALSLSSAMHSLIPVNRNGDPLAPMITWADTRAADAADRLRKAGEAEEIYRLTGTPIHSMSPLCKLVWMKEQGSPLLAQTGQFISIKEFIWFRLFGKFQVDHSIASATGLFNPVTLDWEPEAVRMAGISPDQLSVPVPTSYYLTVEDEALLQSMNLSPATPFFIGASDGCFAPMGSGASGPGRAALTLGTSGAIRICSPEPVFRFASMLFNYRLDEQTFVCGGPVNNGGNVLHWLLKNFMERETLSEEAYNRFFERVEATPPGSEGLLFLPYLHGERAPIWDEKSCGVFFGIRSHHTQAHFLRAGLEGVCFALLQIMEQLEDATGPVQQVHVSGGFVRSSTWVRILADCTGKPVVLIGEEDASAIGAALFARKHLHWSDSFAPEEENGQILEPDRGRMPIYRENFARFKKLYPLLKEVMQDR